jgi:hypothetical protein
MSLLQNLASLGVVAEVGPAQATQNKPNDGRYSYWRRPDAHPTQPGFVMKAPCWPTEHRKRARRGWVELSQYGEFYDVWDNGQTMTRDPWRHILLSGGAKEFPLAQIRRLQWHRFPPAYVVPNPVTGVQMQVTIAFPQLQTDAAGNIVLPDGTVWTDFACPDCAPTDPNAWCESEIALRKHQSVIHKQVAGQRQLASEIANANRAQAEPVNQAITLLAELLKDMRADQKAAVLAQLQDEEPKRKGRKPEEPQAA